MKDYLRLYILCIVEPLGFWDRLRQLFNPKPINHSFTLEIPETRIVWLSQISSNSVVTVVPVEPPHKHSINSEGDSL